MTFSILPSAHRPGREARSIPSGKARVSVLCKPKAGTPSTVPAKRGPRVPDRDHDDLNDQFGPTPSSDLTINLDHPPP